MDHSGCIVHAVSRRDPNGATFCGLETTIEGLREAGLGHAHVSSGLRDVTCPVCIDVREWEPH
jgi:hypothetical protein